MNHSNINLDRKILADLAENEPFSFKAVIDEVKIQTKLGLEDSPRNPIEAFSNAVADRLVALPGSKIPLLEEMKHFASIKPYDSHEFIHMKYTQPEGLTEPQRKELEQEDWWESDWEDFDPRKDHK